MRRAPLLTCLASAGLVAGLAAALRSGAMPLGVRGEWEWLRLPVAPAAVDVALAAAAVVLYALFSGAVGHALAAGATPAREASAVSALLAASVLVQAAAQSGAPAGYGLAKWVVALHQRGSSGYFLVAKGEAGDLRGFLAGYPEWVRRQDALHLGTHPPGLIATQALLLHTVEGSPASARFVEEHMPGSVALMFRVYGRDWPLSPADRATLALTGFSTLLACSATVVPLYLLARASLDAPGAWAAASLWPLVPSAVLFQPTADTAFPALSTAALALAAHAGRGPLRRRLTLSLLTGTLLALGMQLSLVFLAVGLVVALVLAADRGRRWPDRAVALLATGAGFLGVTVAVWLVTTANPFVIWWWNQRNHARFYAEFPRSYRAWVVANPVELAVALGLPASVWALLAFGWPRGVPRAGASTAAVLAFLTLSGRNLSEVARLWLPLMPALLVLSAYAMGKLGAGPKTLAAAVALVGAETLALEAAVQVVYPV